MENSRRSEEEDEEMSGGIQMIWKKVVTEWGPTPYYCQRFNATEPTNWRFPLRLIPERRHQQMLESFYEDCMDCESFDFTIELAMVGRVKLCSYSELQKMADFRSKNKLHETFSGRLFDGAIGEGSKEQCVIVKTWDFLLPTRVEDEDHLSRFCAEIELFTNGKANSHPNLLKLQMFCCERKLAAVFDGKFTGLLSRVILADEFGWDKRIKVAGELANLLAWLHGKGIAVGSVTPSCIMIDEEANIKVFDFGYISNNVHEGSEIPFEVRVRVEREAPEVRKKGKRTMKSDVYIFGLQLLELVSKEEFDFYDCEFLNKSVRRLESEKKLVNESFTVVDPETASAITELTLGCMNLDPDKRPTMKMVSEYFQSLVAANREKRKSDGS